MKMKLYVLLEATGDFARHFQDHNGGFPIIIEKKIYFFLYFDVTFLRHFNKFCTLRSAILQITQLMVVSYNCIGSLLTFQKQSHMNFNICDTGYDTGCLLKIIIIITLLCTPSPPPF